MATYRIQMCGRMVVLESKDPLPDQDRLGFIQLPADREVMRRAKEILLVEKPGEACAAGMRRLSRTDRKIVMAERHRPGVFDRNCQKVISLLADPEVKGG